MNIQNVTARIVMDVTGLDKTDASAFVRLMVAQGHAQETGNRKNLALSGDAYIVVRGRPSVTFDVDSVALAGYIGTDKAAKLADKAAQDHAAYVQRLAHAEQAAKDKRDATAKAAKVASLSSKLAALKGTGEVF